MIPEDRGGGGIPLGYQVVNGWELQMKKPPPMRGQNRNRGLLLAARHATTLAFVGIDRNQKSISIGVGEFVALHVGAVIEGTVHFEAVIVLGSEILDILQDDAFAVGAGLALQLHGGHLTTA